jgi:pilus assembly protein CpaB
VSVTTGGISAVVAPGKRAIAVAGDKVIGLAGFIQPGNHVDILVTLKSPFSESHITKLVWRISGPCGRDTDLESI